MSTPAPVAADTRLILPYDVEGAVIHVLDRRHSEHLAKIERHRGLQPRTVEPFVTVVRWTDAEGIRLVGDTTPCCLLGVIGAPDFTRNEDNAYDVTLQLGMQITVMGQRRRDVLLRREVMAWATLECVLQRLPRTGLVSGVRPVDYEPAGEADEQRIVGDVRLVFELDVPGMVSAVGLPVDDSPWPPGQPGGPPEDPYGPPLELPLATDVSVDVDREPINAESEP
jgi:hypothetical protein